jgi:hypothetical protein
MATKTKTTDPVLVSRVWAGRHSLNVEHIEAVDGRVVRVRIDRDLGGETRGEIKLFDAQSSEWKSVYRVPTGDMMASQQIIYAEREYDHETGTYSGQNHITVADTDADFDLAAARRGQDLAEQLPGAVTERLEADRDDLRQIAAALVGAIA